MVKPFKKYLLTAFIINCLLGNVYGQSHAIKYDVSLISEKDWLLPKGSLEGYKIGNYQNAPALLLINKVDDYKSSHVAFLRNLNFSDGVIEADLASPGGNGGFVGIAFRIADENHYETLYFRPGASGTINAIQYMPKIGTEFNWWDYESDKYQASTILPLAAWFHIKAVIKANTLTVYVNGNKIPALNFSALNPSLKSGSVGFWLGNCPTGAYKNLTITTN